MKKTIRVTVWNEGRHEKTHEAVRNVYPTGIHGALAEFLGKNADMAVRTATLDDPEHGLTDEVLASTDVLTWWGHVAHKEVNDDIVTKIQQRVLEGMGLLVMHSGHKSKIFMRMMGTSGSLKWREVGEKERLWVIEPSHPIASGLGEYVELPHEEMYGERFDIPQPDRLIFTSWFEGGEVFRSGCCWLRGHGKIFYFRPGHETYPTYHNPTVQQIITNAVRWLAPDYTAKHTCPNTQPLEIIRTIDPATGKAGVRQN